MTDPRTESDPAASREAPPALEAPPERVLSTLNRDGSRRWLRPVPSPGRLLRRRRVVGWALIALFIALPWIRIGGRPAILLDLPAREFTFFGVTFLPTDTLLLMLFLAGVFVTIFLLTALFGRVWCGWACPQTVYLEFVYRPIERLFDGPPDAKGRLRRSPPAWRAALKYPVYLVVSLLIAHVFVAYFVGVDNLFQWVRQSPFEHPRSFLVMAAVTGLMMFDFSFFREQTCIVACPYGRFQSVLLDRRSVIVAYDERRGEPRGPIRRAKPDGDVALPQLGDCIDCRMCVATCPTGIDIRDGLQMECVHCAQCIDACNAVMRRVKRPEGLIRYSSQDAMAQGRSRRLRPRIVLYPLLLGAIATTFLVVLLGRASADVTLLRGTDTPYTTTEDGAVRNELRVKIVNRAREPRSYVFAVEDVEGAVVEPLAGPVVVEPGETRTVPITVRAPRSAFALGRAAVHVRVRDGVDYDRAHRFRLQGPWGGGSHDDDDGEDDE